MLRNNRSRLLCPKRRVYMIGTELLNCVAVCLSVAHAAGFIQPVTRCIRQPEWIMSGIPKTKLYKRSFFFFSSACWSEKVGVLVNEENTWWNRLHNECLFNLFGCAFDVDRILRLPKTMVHNYRTYLNDIALECDCEIGCLRTEKLQASHHCIYT